MSRKSSRSRWVRPSHANRARRLTRFENLEGRQMMTATLFLDFGQAFQLAASGEHIFQAAGLDSLAVNAPSDTSVPDQLNSVLDALQERGIDYNADGGVTTSDVVTLAQDVLQLVRRYYEPFDITVQIAASANLGQVVDLVTGRAGNDAYILIGGEQANNGIANVDPGNTEDNIAFAFAETLIDKVDSDRSLLAMALAHTAAHEAAHTFGLRHLDESPTTDESMLAAGDTMDVADGLRHRKLKVFSRFDLAKDGGGTQNDFQVLKDALGLRSNAPAFVTGTGAHDTIEINGIGNNQAQVIVKAFRNNGFAAADLIAETSYTIDVSRGVLVEAGFGDDHVITNVAKPVTMRGGQGNDTLLGGGSSDRLQGDHGNDFLSGLAGSDTYIFAGPRWWDLDDDTINDVSGARDTLDFSAFGNHVSLDLASTAMQTVDPYIPVISPVNGFSALVGFPTFHNPHLKLQLLPGPFTTSTGIENVIGSQQSDVIRGNALANSLSGLGGNDQLEGRAGNDVLSGGAGNDRYLFSGSLLGTDTIKEGTFGGFDTLDFTGFNHAIDVSLAIAAEQNLGGGNLRLRQSVADMLENVVGTRFDDIIRGNGLANFLQGGEGADIISGGAGNDVIKGGAGNDYLYGENGLDEIYGDADNDFLEGGYDGLVDLLLGGQGADTFVRYHTYINTIYSKGDLVFHPIAEADKYGDFNAAEDFIQSRFV